jgi:hypothetical protein
MPGRPKGANLRVEILRLELLGRELGGELALDLPPGTTAAVRDQAIDEQLNERLTDEAARLHVAVAAAPSRFAHPRNGKDAQGRTLFELRGRIEGDRLLPVRKVT